MRSFAALFEQAAARKGGPAEIETLFPTMKSADELRSIPDHRWLAGMTRCIFQAGFSWRVIETKWPGFEEAFEGFDPARWTMMSDEDFDRLVADKRIVRHPVKIRAVAGNAMLLRTLAEDHGSAAGAFADWPSQDLIGLLALLKAKGDRMGETTAQYFLRYMGKDGFVLSKDVVTALIREGIIDKPSAGKRAMQAIQDGFNHWQKESGRPLAHISRTLAMTV